jgi:hypothetical protein
MKTQKAIPFEIINLDDDGFHLMLKGEVNKHECNLILDTGASKTALDKGFISSIIGEDELKKVEKLSSGLGTNEMEIHEIILKEFKIESHVWNDYEVAVIDLKHVNFAYEKMQLDKIHGIIGNDILVSHHAMIDYKSKQMWLH